ncbi:MAG: response regulator [Fibromonadaceae bacterium]|jgi:PAS domain S-box-containing protein|nr:response regulator [Fibromonadaceae bacterium]
MRLEDQEKKNILWEKSIGFRLTVVLVALSLIVGISMLVFLTYVYQNRINAEFKNKAVSMSKIVASMVEGETIDRYLSTLEKDEEYERLLELMRVAQRETGTAYIYVSKIDETREIFVFDSDENEEGRMDLGKFLPFAVDSYSGSNRENARRYLRGEQTEPFINETDWGRLLIASERILRKDGSVAAYANASVFVDDILRERNFAIIVLAMVTLLVTFIFPAIVLYAIQKFVVTPVRILVKSVISYRPDTVLPEFSLQSKPVLHSGDEFEILEHAIINMKSRIENTMVEHEHMSSRIEAMINNLPGMVFQQLYNPPEYTYTFVSDGCIDLLGYTAEELMSGKVKFFDMTHKDDIELIEKISAQTLPLELPFEATFRIMTKDGTMKWIWERSRVIEKNSDGSPSLIEGYYADITKHYQLEATELANRAKSDFLAKMSHEIRTPMNSIMGFAELAIDCEFMPQVNEYLGKISDSTKWLLRIINDILDISKIEAGKLEMEHIPFNLQEVFSRCQSVILPTVKDKNLDLSIYMEPSIGKKLLGDPVRLYQVFINLLSNAVKFTNSGTVKFLSAIKSTTDNSTTIYFEVRDTGIGMKPEQVKKIFDPFVQADSSTTRDYGGTGLGLAIVKNIVELMGGKLKVESTFGAGSAFSFELTFDTIDAQDDTSQKKFDILERPRFSGLVLICDDNSMNQQVICAHLARVGLQTVTVENGKLGVDMVKKRKENNEKPFDLILMHMFMPVMDGMEAASKITALETGTPIVAVTANVMVSELEKYKKNGMPDCLGKPFTTQELWQVLLKYFTPLSSELIDDIDEYCENEEQLKMMQLNFYKNNQTVHLEIAEAVAAGDTKLAHRLAHTLKGNAGMLGKVGLKNAALDVESLLKEGAASIWESKMSKLESELMLVLEELKPQFDDSPAAPKEIRVLDAEQTQALFDKLEPMLENINPGCIKLLDDIRAVPGTEELVLQIERFNFKEAAKTLAGLKEKLEKADE